MGFRYEWRLPNEDYEGSTDVSVLEVSEDGKTVEVSCNGMYRVFHLDSVPETVTPTPFKYCVNPDDRNDVDACCQRVFGVRVGDPVHETRFR